MRMTITALQIRLFFRLTNR